MNNLLWHQLKISISIAYSFDNFWSYFLENLSIFYMQLTIVFVHFDYSFCQFCAWIFFVFSASYLHSELMITATKFSLSIQTNYEQNTHGSIWTKMAIFDERRWDTLQNRKQKLKNDFVYFAAFKLNWVALLDQWMLKSWINQKFGFISYLLYTAIFDFQSLDHKLPFKKYPSNFYFHFWAIT